MNKVWISTSNTNYYKVINKLNELSINIHDQKIESNKLLLLVDINDYLYISKYLITIKFDIYKKTGINNIYNILKNNKLILLSSILGIILILLLNTIIVEVSIMHENKDIVSLLEDELKIHGIKPLSQSKSYEELTSIKEIILSNNEDLIDWLEIEKQGMKYIIKVEERIITSIPQEKEYCNVYAKKSGIIKSMKIDKGVVLVDIGDYVLEGDLLISGDILLNDEVKSLVCASGTIMAESWYETSVTVPYKYFKTTNTGVSRYNLALKYNNKTTKILRDRIENYESKYYDIFNLFGYNLLLEKQTVVEKQTNYYTKEEALDYALNKAKETINLKLDSKSYIIDQKVLKNIENDSTIEVDIFTITLEVIN